MTLPDSPQFYMLCTTLITTIAGVITMLHNSRQDRLMREEDRLDRERHRREMAESLAENTRLTKDGIEKTEQFATVANGVNEKMIMLGKAGLISPELLKAFLEFDRAKPSSKP